MADDQLSKSEVAELQEVAKSLPAGHPYQSKISLLLNSQPTQFEKDRPGGGTTEAGPLEHGGYKEPSMTKGAGTAAVETLKRMIPESPTGGLSILDPKAWWNPDELHFDPAHGGLAEAGREAIAGFGRGSGTLSKIGTAAASGLGSLVGVSGRREAEHAARGESGAIIGETAVPAATTLAAYGLPKVLPKIGSPIPRIADVVNKNPAVARLILGSDRAAALRELTTPVAKVEPIRSAAPAAELKPIVRAPEEVFQRPIEAAPGAGKGAAPAEMHPEELAAIRKEAGKPEMSAEEAHRFRVNKMASAAASAKPANDLGGMKRAGDVTPIEQPQGPAKLPTLFQKEVRPQPIKIENLVEQAAGVKPLKLDVPLREQLSPQPTSPGEVVDPIKAKYPDPAVRQMVRANGEKIYEAAKGRPATVKAIHDLTRVELRQALVNAGEDMGQMTVSNSKFAGEGSIPREEAFNRLLAKGLKPEQIIKLAKQTTEKAPAEFMPEEPPQPRVSNLVGQRAARDRAARIREARQ